MSVISKLTGGETSDLSNPKQWLINLLGGQESSSGINVNEKNAMMYSAVFNAVRLYAETLASLPLHTYKRKEDGKEKATTHHLYPLLHRQPNPEMTAMNWKEAQMAHVLLWGNCYAEIERDNANRVKALWPLLPDRTWPDRDKSGQLYFKTMLPSGKRVKLPAKNILHIPGLSLNGINGLSVIGYAREAIGLGLATEKFGAKFFGNNSTPGGILKHPEQLSPQAHDNLKADFEAKHGGLDNAHRIAILEEGMEWQQIGIPPGDSQFLETRKFQITEVARWFNLPPHMLKDLDRATFSNIEQQSLEFVIFSLRPWLVRWEQGFKKDLFSNNKYFAEFVVDGLLRGDIESRYNAYATGRQWGWLSINDIRELENMNPIPNGDQHLQPLNMISIESKNPRLESNSKPISAEERQKKIKEARAKRSAVTRSRLTERYKDLIKNSVENMLEYEIKQIREKAKEELQQRNAGNFKQWVEEFYQEFPKDIRDEMRPVLASFGEAISEEAMKEINVDDIDGLDNFIDEYTEAMAATHVGYSKSQLDALVDEALEENKDTYEVIDERLNEWEEKRADKIAVRESVKEAGAVSLFTYKAGGVVKKRWYTVGESCPFCQKLDGKVVGIEKNFINAGDSIEVEEKDEALTVSSNKGHPPAHSACDCMIVAEQ